MKVPLSSAYNIYEMNDISTIRKDYKLQLFNEDDANSNPFLQFENWWNDAVNSQIDEVNAMTLATVDEEQKPSARIVLLKGIKPDGYEFFTNYESKKANQMANNNNVALIFFWKELERQIRIEGKVFKTEPSISDNYYMSRPMLSRIGAWASPQSTIIPNRITLEKAVDALTKKFETEPISRPAFWGGYIVKPTLFEFWQGRRSRLHDRIEYVLNEEKEWKMRRLAP